MEATAEPAPSSPNCELCFRQAGRNPQQLLGKLQKLLVPSALSAGFISPARHVSDSSLVAQPHKFVSHFLTKGYLVRWDISERVNLIPVISPPPHPQGPCLYLPRSSLQTSKLGRFV